MLSEYNLYSKNTEIGCFSFYIYSTRGECNILNIFINEKYRNMGYGTYILNYIKKFCIERNVKKITLDDCSDNFNKENNLYIKYGFKYINKNYPEMIFIIHN